MTLLLNRPMAAGSTLQPLARPEMPALRSAEDFYLHGANGESHLRLEIRVWDAGESNRRTWLAAYAEEQLNSLLRLRPGWDGYRARPLTMEATKTAVDILFAIVDDLSLPPQIFPLRDGGIQLEWHSGDEDIEIEVDAAGRAHVLATDAKGEIVLNEELDRGRVLDLIKEAVRGLSDRLAGAQFGNASPG